MKRLVVALLCVVALAACGDDGDDGPGGGLGALATTTTEAEAPEETTTTEAEATTTTTEAADGLDLPDGWREVGNEEFAMGLPEGWIDGEQILEDPELATFLEDVLGGEANARATLAQVDLIAFEETAVSAGFGNNVNVIANPRSPLDELDTIEPTIESQLAPIGATVTSIERVDGFGGEAMRVEYDYDLEGESLLGYLYFILGEETTAVVTFTASTGSEQPETYADIASTLTFVG